MQTHPFSVFYGIHVLPSSLCLQPSTAPTLTLNLSTLGQALLPCPTQAVSTLPALGAGWDQNSGFWETTTQRSVSPGQELPEVLGAACPAVPSTEPEALAPPGSPRCSFL